MEIVILKNLLRLDLFFILSETQEIHENAVNECPFTLELVGNYHKIQEV